MGELICTIGKIVLGGNEYAIEVNKPNKAGEEDLIHIQNKRFRYECSKAEFICYATSVLRARDNFLYYKKKGER